MPEPLHWQPPPPITAVRAAGRYVVIDPIDPAADPPRLWEALGGDAGINEHLAWFGLPRFVGGDDWGRFLADQQSPDGPQTNVFRDPDGRVVGMASFMSTIADHGVTEVGYVAHGPAMMRSPAATEAHYLLARHAFAMMGYRRYEWKCNADNLPSRRAALRLGFVYEGTFRHHRVARDLNRDTAYFSMTDRDWPACRGAFEAWLSPHNFDDTGRQRVRLEDLREQERLRRTR